VAAGVVIGGTFLLTLIVVSVITVRFSDMVLDTASVRSTDARLLFGLGRGLLIVVVAFLFFAWLVPPRTSQPGSPTPSRGCPAVDRRLADVDVAGRPREHHLEEAEAAKGTFWRHRALPAPKYVSPRLGQ